MMKRFMLVLTLVGNVVWAQAEFDKGMLSGLPARNIGSAAMSGRISSLAARVEEDGNITVFIGAASGGVWKSTDGATSFTPVFDKQTVQSIGAVALDPSNPKVVWVGTGEPWTRNSVSVGDGIYKSTDGGDTWQSMGLPNSERITKILVHPKNSDIVYACVPGRLWSDSSDRGLYKTIDGGKTWALVLKGSNLSTGCASVAMDPTAPDKLFASLWDFRRKGWTFRSGGDGPNAPSGSALLSSNDGGKTWASMEPNATNKLPAKPWGRIAVAIAPNKPSVVYAVVEAVKSALFRSDDGGKTWDARDNSQAMVWRPFYFSNLIVDPTNADRIFKPNGPLIVSDDGGKSFSVTSGGTHGDHHDVWVNPKNPKHIITADDGGLWISHNGGGKWWKSGALPISQFYHVSVDDKDPYQVYGGLQDNSSWVGDSQYPGGITNNRWENVYGGDGFYVFSDSADPDYIYAEYQGGNIARIHRKTHAGRDIQPKAKAGEKLRWNWNTPLHLSPTNKGVLYMGAQFLFRTKDHGQSWERISPDLTTNNPQKQKQEESGGITVDNSSAEMHTTIYAIAESPKDAKTIWVGTDDGNLQVTRNAGKNWTNVVANISGLPAASWVSSVTASLYDACTAYVTFDRHMEGVFDPYAYRTRDCGKTFERVASPEQGIRGYAHILKEDAQVKDLLFLGTELGLFISIDGGKKWAEFKGNNFPSVAVRDLAMPKREGDLVIGTHGRGIWIIDDLTTLRALAAKPVEAEVAFLPIRPVEQRIEGSGGWPEGDSTFYGDNPSSGAVISYFQKTRHVFGKLQLDVLNDKGEVVESLAPSKRRGINRVVWSMKVKAPTVPTAAQIAGAGFQGPRVVPGTYTARLVKNGKTYETKFEVKLDRRATYTVADRKAQFDAVMKAHGLFGQMAEVVNTLNGLKKKGEASMADPKADEPTKTQIAAFVEKSEVVRREIVATKEGGAITGEERLREQLDYAYGALMSFEGKPGDYQVARVEALRQEFEAVKARADALMKELPALNQLLKSRQMPELTLQDIVTAGEQLAAQRAWEQAESQSAGVAATRNERD